MKLTFTERGRGEGYFKILTSFPMFINPQKMALVFQIKTASIYVINNR